MRPFIVFLFLSADIAAAGSLGTVTSKDGELTLAITMDQPEDTIVHNRLTALQVRVLPSIDAEGRAKVTEPIGGLQYSARMRDFDIGSILETKVTEVMPLHYRIEGVKLHVPGVWQIQLLFNVGDRIVAFEKTVIAKPSLGH